MTAPCIDFTTLEDERAAIEASLSLASAKIRFDDVGLMAFGRSPAAPHTYHFGDPYQTIPTRLLCDAEQDLVLRAYRLLQRQADLVKYAICHMVTDGILDPHVTDNRPAEKLYQDLINSRLDTMVFDTEDTLNTIAVAVSQPASEKEAPTIAITCTAYDLACGGGARVDLGTGDFVPLPWGTARTPFYLLSNDLAVFEKAVRLWATGDASQQFCAMAVVSRILLHEILHVVDLHAHPIYTKESELDISLCSQQSMVDNLYWEFLRVRFPIGGVVPCIYEVGGYATVEVPQMIFSFDMDDRYPCLVDWYQPSDPSTPAGAPFLIWDLP